MTDDRVDVLGKILIDALGLAAAFVDDPAIG